MSRLVAALLAAVAPMAASAQMPVIDTEDAQLGGAAVGPGRLHATATVDIRNGDFVRGDVDDDPADLDRLPVHLQLGLGYRLDAGTDAWLVLRSSNGFHEASARERERPRSWYETNNLVGIVATPAPGFRAGLAYTIKYSPNAVSGTTHEASATFAYEADRGVGVLEPSLVVTRRTRGPGGLFTLAGIELALALSDAENGPRLTVPAAFGVGWGGFYGGGTGDRVFGSVGAAYVHPFTAGRTRLRLRAELLGIVRDDGLRRLATPGAETSTVVPLGTVSLTIAY